MKRSADKRWILATAIATRVSQWINKKIYYFVHPRTTAVYINYGTPLPPTFFKKTKSALVCVYIYLHPWLFEALACGLMPLAPSPRDQILRINWLGRLQTLAGCSSAACRNTAKQSQRDGHVRGSVWPGSGFGRVAESRTALHSWNQIYIHINRVSAVL